MASSEFSYVGSELELFQSASNWKQYYGAMVAPYLGSRVLEVGAGLGATTQALCKGRHEFWLCLEPDPELCAQISQRLADDELPGCCAVSQSTVADLSVPAAPQTILYIDVLEHIAADRDELWRATSLLSVGGYLVVLAPAHRWLFTPFDEAVGHHRRYTRKTLRELTPPGTRVVLERYLDSVGIGLSLANKLITRRRVPTRANISFWDRCVVPLSRWVDPLLGYRCGKSVLLVWQKLPDSSTAPAV